MVKISRHLKIWSTGCVNFKKMIHDNQTIERIWLGVGLRRKGVAVKKLEPNIHRKLIVSQKKIELDSCAFLC